MTAIKLVWCNACTFCAIAWFRPEIDLSRGGTSKRVKERPKSCSHISTGPADVSAYSEMPNDFQKVDSTSALQHKPTAHGTPHANCTHNGHFCLPLDQFRLLCATVLTSSFP